MVTIPLPPAPPKQSLCLLNIVKDATVKRQLSAEFSHRTDRQCQWAWWVCGSVVSEQWSLFSQPHHTCTALCDVSKWTWSAPCFWWQQQSARPLHVTASACCTVADFSQPRVYFSPNRHPELFIHNPLCADALIINCSADCGSCKNC